MNIMTAFAFVLLFVIFGMTHGQICNTQGCLTAANMLLANMDKTQDPCTNFYQFACGNFIKTHPANGSTEQSSHKILEKQVLLNVGLSLNSIWQNDTTFPRSVRTASLAYKACMTSSTSPMAQPLIQLLSSLTDGQTSVGGWPMISPNWNYNGFKIEGLVAQLQAHYSTYALMFSSVDGDWGYPNQYALYLDQAWLIFGATQRYTNTLFASDRAAYINTLVKVAQLLRADTNATSITDAQIMADANAVLQFETAIARKKIIVTEQRNVKYFYQPMNFNQLQARWPSINWTVYYGNLLSLHNPNYLSQLKQRIIVNSPGFIDRLHDDIGGNVRTVVNYLLWRLILNNIAFLPTSSPYYKAWAEFKVATDGSLPPSSDVCANMIVQYMPLAAGYVYVRNYFPAQAHADVQNMMGNMQAAFAKIINSAPWLDASSKYQAQKKRRTLLQVIGFPSWLMNGTRLDAYYSGFINSINPSLSYFYVLQFLRINSRKIHFQKLGQPINRLQPYPPIDYSLVSSAATYGRYWVSLNSLMIPAAAMNPPYYRYDFPRSVNYGALGQYAGYLWMYGFDYIGSQFTSNGTFMPWMSSSSGNSFASNLQCLTSQFSKYCYGPINNYMCVDGLLTQSANFNELTGLLAAYQAYQIWVALHGPEQLLPGLTQYSPNQIFFLSYVSSRCHSYNPQQIKQLLVMGSTQRGGPPADYATIGTLQNLDIFGAAFNCKRGSAMWPQVGQQCHIYNQPPPNPSPGPTLPPAPSTVNPVLTSGWTAAAQIFSGAINKQVNPCVDFYQYACGGWQKANPITTSIPYASTGYNQQKNILNQIIANLNALNINDPSQPQTPKTAKIFYQSCIRATLAQAGNVNALLSSLKGFGSGGFPMITPGWKAPPANFNLWATVAYLESFYIVPTLMFSFISIDWKNTQQNALYIDPGQLALGSRVYYINPAFKSSLQAYKNLIISVGQQLANDAKVTVSSAQLAADAQAIVNFETQLANIQISQNQYLNHPNMQYNEFNPTKLMQRWPNIDWINYIYTLLAIHIPTFSNRFIVTEPSYIDQLHGLLMNTTSRTIVNYIGWRLIYRNMEFISFTMKNLADKFHREAADINFNLPLPNFECAQLLVDYIPMGAARVYVGNNGTQYDQVRAAAGFQAQKIVAGLVQAIQSGNTLDAVSKYKSTIKFNGVVADIGFPRWILNNAQLDAYHSGYINLITSPDGGAFWHNIQLLKKERATNYFKQILQPSNRKQWSLSPAWDFAFYQMDRNSLVLGIGSLTAPKFRLDFPQAVKFGILGSQIGITLGQGLNNRGSQFFRNGSLTSWLSPTAQLSLQTAGLCIQNQYNKYCYPQMGNICVNGQNTMSSNMADLIGLQAAYNGYHSSMAFYGADQPLPGLEQFNPDQLFFLGYAYGFCENISPSILKNILVVGQSSPAYWRVNGVLRNMPVFGKAFACNVGVDPMAPLTSSQCRAP